METVFFGAEEDMLTQLNLMDFVVDLGRNPHSSLILGKTRILERLFSKFKGDSLASGNLLQAAGLLFSLDQFELHPSFVDQLKSSLFSSSSSEQAKACTCLHFLFKNKLSFPQLFIPQPEIIKRWLQFATNTDPEVKKSFMVGLHSLLLPGEQEEAIRRTFSNVKSPQNFPNMG
mmetsp:Transcript_39482/g.29160  ORF Transcript_39482/g.29160 Transcript_39482/m.29160 type:complete len:174 (-) Transcript_39482:302-823(-)